MDINGIKNKFLNVLIENKYFAIATMFLVLAFIVFLVASVYNMIFMKEKYADIPQGMYPEEYQDEDSMKSSIEHCDIQPYEV